jgi:transposase InsO family protein
MPGMQRTPLPYRAKNTRFSFYSGIRADKVVAKEVTRQMIDEKTRVGIALKRFSIISPIINGQVASISEYSREATKAPIEMPHYGCKNYAPKTIGQWYSDYIKGGIDALKPAPRSDRGTSRVLSPEMCESILNKLKEYPKAPATVIYDQLIEGHAFLKKDASIATVRRFIRENRIAAGEGTPKTQKLRFGMEHVNELWMTDIMYGPYVGTKKKQATYLLAYIDDASRLITHAEFYLSQDMASLRNSFRDAVLRRGLPKVLYTDNGKIYRSQGFEYLCANIGVTLLHHAVGAAHQKGKVERFFHTVRLRFISILKSGDLESIDTLNEKFGAWLQNDYQKRPHEGLSGDTPLDFFLKQSEQITLVTDLAEFNQKLLLTVSRTVKPDATISFGKRLYETEMFLAGERLNVKYDPDAKDGIDELFLYRGDKPVGVARLVNYVDNSRRKRSGPPKASGKPSAIVDSGDGHNEPVGAHKTNTISYSDALGGGA